MRLPNREHVQVPEEKLRAYLLSRSHPVGKSKARFFRGLGFDESSVDQLREALRTVAQRAEVEEIEQTPHGSKYVLVGALPTPDGEPVSVRTVWIIEEETDGPRFVTAYPA